MRILKNETSQISFAEKIIPISSRRVKRKVDSSVHWLQRGESEDFQQDNSIQYEEAKELTPTFIKPTMNDAGMQTELSANISLLKRRNALRDMKLKVEKLNQQQTIELDPSQVLITATSEEVPIHFIEVYYAGSKTNASVDWPQTRGK